MDQQRPFFPDALLKFTKSSDVPDAPWCWNIYEHLPLINDPVMEVNMPAPWVAYGCDLVYLCACNVQRNP